MTTVDPPPRWPSELTWVRHGESVGNVEARRARRAGEARLNLASRDADSPLSAVGQGQAAAVGAWWAGQPAGRRPQVVLSSPYRRARDTAAGAVAAAGLDVEVGTDERLRERDLGTFDGLTAAGVRELFAAEAERRTSTGKLYYRPPGGESWCDVALRVRSVLDTWREAHAGRRVVVFTHQAVIMSARMVIEGLDEADLLGLDRGAPLANCSLTTYSLSSAGGLALAVANDTSALDHHVPLTTEPDADLPH